MYVYCFHKYKTKKLYFMKTDTIPIYATFLFYFIFLNLKNKNKYKRIIFYFFILFFEFKK